MPGGPGPSSYAAMLWSSGGVPGTQISNSTTQASLLPAQAKKSLPAGFLTYKGQKLRLLARGEMSCVVTTPGNVLFQVLFGAIVVATSQNINLNVVAKTNVTWWLDWELEVASIGAGTAATLIHTGTWKSEAHVGAAANTAGGIGEQAIPATSIVAGTGFDETVANIVDLQGKFSVNTAGTNMILRAYEFWSLN